MAKNLARLELDQLPLDKSIKRSAYDKKLKKLQIKLTQIQQAYLFGGQSAVLVFEGWDAAGKGGTIRRISAALDPRSFKVWPIGAPRPWYLDRHWLVRFWSMLPPHGAISVFDRSWYGRVLVERVEGLAPEREWLRAYSEINRFEEQLCQHGSVVLKFWLHISKDEQLKRFEAREATPHKQHKLTGEDWRNREKWHDYEMAVHDMVTHTSTVAAPWTLVAGNSKRYARIQILKTFCEALEARLKTSG
jgi:polyphosphate kinase 2 (PPK2 family)